MSSSMQLLVDNQPVSDDLFSRIDTIEVEENVDMPGAIELQIAVGRSTDGDLDPVNDPALQPFANVAVVVTADGQPPECIFDGFILSQRIHLETGTTASTLRVWGQDASWLMNLEEKVREWSGMTDGMAANSIFSEYGFIPAPENTDDDSPAHTEDGQTLMQRATDVQFLQLLARRGGKFARVACGPLPGVRTGYFVRPNLDPPAEVTLNLNDKEQWNVAALDVEWDVTRPTEVAARQALFTSSDETGVQGDTDSSELAPLDDRDLATFAGRSIKAQLTANAFDADDLAMRARALLTESGWFVRCEGDADVARLKKVLRAATVVELEGIGSVHSGKYFVWSVRHSITSVSHRMHFVLVRNAVGPAPAGGAFSGGGL